MLYCSWFSLFALLFILTLNQSFGLKSEGYLADKSFVDSSIRFRLASTVLAKYHFAQYMLHVPESLASNWVFLSSSSKEFHIDHVLSESSKLFAIKVLKDFVKRGRKNNLYFEYEYEIVGETIEISKLTDCIQEEVDCTIYMFSTSSSEPIIIAPFRTLETSNIVMYPDVLYSSPTRNGVTGAYTATGVLVDNYCMTDLNGNGVDGSQLFSYPQQHYIGCFLHVPPCYQSSWVFISKKEGQYSIDYFLSSNSQKFVENVFNKMSTRGRSDNLQFVYEFQLGANLVIDLTKLSDCTGGSGCIVYTPDGGESTGITTSPTSAITFSPTSRNCLNGIKDETETDVDCGGRSCASCRNGKLCIVNDDCISDVCESGKCQAFTKVVIDLPGSDLQFYFNINSSENIQIRISVPLKRWIGFALAGTESDFNKMIGGRAIIGIPLDSNPSFSSVGLYTLKNTDISGVTSDGPLSAFGIFNASFTATDSESTLKFSLNQNLPGALQLVSYSDSKLTPYLFTFGVSDIFGFHQGNRGVFYYNLKDINTDNAAQTKSVTSLLAAHIAFGLITFAIFFPLGAVIALVHDRTSPNPNNTWFKLHRGLQLTGSCFSLVTLGLGAGYTTQIGGIHFSKSHQIIGLTVICLAIFQVGNGLSRPHLEKRKDGTEFRTTFRIGWENLHRFTGVVILLLGYVNIYLGPSTFYPGTITTQATSAFVVLVVSDVFSSVSLCLVVLAIVYRIVKTIKRQGSMEQEERLSNSETDEVQRV